MRAAVLALALAMLVTGTINTVSVKFQVRGCNGSGLQEAVARMELLLLSQLTHDPQSTTRCVCAGHVHGGA